MNLCCQCGAPAVSGRCYCVQHSFAWRAYVEHGLRELNEHLRLHAAYDQWVAEHPERSS